MSNSRIEVAYTSHYDKAGYIRWLDEATGQLFQAPYASEQCNCGFTICKPATAEGARVWRDYGGDEVTEVLPAKPEHAQTEAKRKQLRTADEMFAAAAAPDASLEHRKNGKVQMDLVVEGFPHLHHELGKMLTWAAVEKGYKRHDWKGYDEATFLSAAERHRNKRLRGELVDDESGLDHRVHEAFNLMAAAEVALMKEKNNG